MARGMTTPFVARGAQVAALTAALDRAADGSPTVVLVGGDAGVGKTRLLDHLAEQAARSGATAVTVHCVDLGEVGLPYLPFAEALARLADAPGLGSAVHTVLDARPALARLLPGSDSPLTGAGEDEAGRLQLFDGVAAVLGAAGRPGHPLVLVVEDLHWADASSRDVLRFLVARLRTEHVLVVASYRTDDLHRRHPLRPVLGELWRHPRVERIDLPPFGPEEMRAFARARGDELGDAALARVMDRSGGNAYFAEELLDAGGDDALPWTLGDVLRTRLERLDPAVQRLAAVASVAGRTVSEPLLRAVASATGTATGASPGTSPGTGTAPRPGGDELDAVLREAVAGHVLVGEEGRLAFRHALLAEAVYADLLPGEQVALHRVYRDVLLADPTLGSPAQLAHHARLCHDTSTALSASLDAAAEAGRLLAPAEELRHLELALRLWDAVPAEARPAGRDRTAVSADAAAAAGRAGLDDRAAALARDAVRCAAGDPVRQATLRVQLGQHLLATEREREALDELEAALAGVPAEPPSSDHAWALAVHARASMTQDLDAQARRSAELAVAEARTVGDAAVEADALATLAVLVVDDAERSAELLAAAQRRAKDAGDLATELRCGFNLAANRYYAGHLDRAATLTDAALTRARAAGLSWSAYAVQLRVFAELVRYATGDLSAPPPSQEAPPPGAAAVVEAIQLYAATARGEPDAADRALALRPEWDRDGQVALVAGGCRTDALTWAGRYDEAVEHAEEVVDHLGRAWTETFLGGIWLAALGIAALADAAEQDRLAGVDPVLRVRRGTALLARAVTTAERGRPRGGRLGPEGRAWLARAHAEHARLSGTPAPDLWQAATEAFDYGYRYEVARSRWRWAEALLQAGDRVGAQAQAHAAAAEAVALGAGPLAAAVQALARRGRLDVPGAHPSGAALLTGREAEVLTLVAQGLSNRQIGERLFISTKTVSVHVSNVLAKLGASGRTEAVTVAHRRGLLGAGRH